MLRQGVRRCAHLASAAAPSLILARSMTALVTARSSVASLSRTPTSLKTIAYASRLYSTETVAAAVQPAQETASDEVVSFDGLSDLGVHKNLLRAITDDMGYGTMTPVQAKTINPALKGTDM